MSSTEHIFISKYPGLSLTREPGYKDQVVGGRIVRVQVPRPPLRFKGGRLKITDEEDYKWVKSHRLHGVYFEELPQEVAAGSTAKKEVEEQETNSKPAAPVGTSDGPGDASGSGKAQSGSGGKQDPKSDNRFEDLPADTKFPYHYGGGMWWLSDGSKVQGKKAEAQAAEDALHQNETDAGSSEDDGETGQGTAQIEPKSITNINQARDFLLYKGVDGKALTSKKSILEEARNLDPPVEFPNLK